MSKLLKINDGCFRGEAVNSRETGIYFIGFFFAFGFESGEVFGQLKRSINCPLLITRDPILQHIPGYII